MNEEQKTIRKTIVNNFKLNGLIVKGDGCAYLCEQLLPVPEPDRDVWISKIVDYLQRKQTIREPIVELSHVQAALQDCCKSEINDTDDVIRVISAFDVPRFDYNVDSKKFVKRSNDARDSTTTSKLCNWASSKTAMFRNRYVILKQKLDRHELLTNDNHYTNTSGIDRRSPKLYTIDRLSCTSHERSDILVLGLLTQLKEGKYFLEDPTGVLPIDLSTVVYHPGLFTENCFVLAEGTYTEDGLLRVSGLAHPPPESSKISRTYYGNVNTFGGPPETSSKFSDRTLQLERDNPEAMIVFVADVFLDRVSVTRKLRTLFAGFEDGGTPIAIVLMGNFLSIPPDDEYATKLAAKFDELADTINRYENLAKDTLFVIVAGSADSPSANILPRPPLPTCITESFKRKVPKSVVTTNPCRIQYCTKEIVVLREDIVTKMCRNCINTPATFNVTNTNSNNNNNNNNNNITGVYANFARTILSQSFLIPLPLSVCPVYCTADNSLSLYPPPDLIIVADGTNAFVEKYKDTIVANPSSFSKRKFIFQVYIPASNQIEDSQIPDT